MPETVKAFGYLRVSGKSQIDGDGLTRQREVIERFAALNDAEIVQWFTDGGVSGTTEWEDRPAWANMIGAVSDDVCTIIVERMDRVARTIMVQEHIVNDLRKRQVILKTADGADTDGETLERKMFRQMLAVIAEYQKCVDVAKLRTARNRIRSTGERCEGRKPYGFHADESKWVEFMQESRKNGLTFDAIALKLNALQVSPRKGLKWYGDTVNKILNRVSGKIRKPARKTA